MAKQKITEEGLVGVFVAPEGEGPLPGVLLLPGSDGGIPDGFASRISLRGFAVLALGYFGLEGLPSSLERIPLEYFEKALHWLKKQKEVDGSIAVVGYSRGGELSLLLGCYFPSRIQAIVAYTPNAFVCGAFPYVNRPAWTFNGHAIAPFLHGVMSEEKDLSEKEDLRLACTAGIIPFHAGTKEDPYDEKDLFLVRKTEGAEIPVEKIACPLLIFSGGEDKIWPSCLYGDLIMKRLEAKGSAIKREHIAYREGGHAVGDGPIYHPHGHFYCHLGGKAEANKKMGQETFEKMISFLKENLLA